MEKRLKISALIPKQHIIPLIFAFTFNMAVYMGARAIAGEWKRSEEHTSELQSQR